MQWLEKLMRLSIDIICLILRINDFLAVVQSVIAGQHITECDGEQEIRHSIVAEQLKADKE